MENVLNLDISRQPDDTTCGPTCLHAVYQFYGDHTSLSSVIEEVEALEEGGTLAVMLAIHALRKGFKATIYTYNLQMFDPTWFSIERPVNIIEKLQQQMAFKNSKKFRKASEAYIEFLQLGGQLIFKDLNGELLRKYLRKNIPILTGLSATYLYNQAREYGINSDHDDLKGSPAGHFVIVSGYDREKRKVLVSDPLYDNPFAHQRYPVSLDKLICAILLGILTYDANLLIIEP